MVIFFLSHDHLKYLGYLSLIILVFQRVTSAIIIADYYGWVTGVLQLFDLEVFLAVYNSIKCERMVLQVIQLKILEGFFESFPELLIQTYYLVRYSQESAQGPMVYVSICLSLL